MRSFSEQLREAVESKIALHPGLMVKVKTKAGKLVTQGRITDVDPDVGFVSIANEDAGADLRVDVDPERYVIWVLPPSSYVPRFPPEATLYIRSSRPGAHAFSNVKM